MILIRLFVITKIIFIIKIKKVNQNLAAFQRIYSKAANTFPVYSLQTFTFLSFCIAKNVFGYAKRTGKTGQTLPQKAMTSLAFSSFHRAIPRKREVSPWFFCLPPKNIPKCKTVFASLTLQCLLFLVPLPTKIFYAGLE